MPHSTSKSKKSMKEIYENLSPSILNIRDVDSALEVWSKYWPILKTDDSLAEFESLVKQRINRNLYIIQGDFEKTKYKKISNSIFYIKNEEDINIVKIYKENTDLDFFPKIEKIKGNQEIWFQDWSNGTKPGYHYMKIDLGPLRVLDRDSDSESSTEMKDPIFIENFSIRGGIIIGEDPMEDEYIFM